MNTRTGPPINLAALRRCLNLRDRTGWPTRDEIEREFGKPLAELRELAAGQ